MPKPKPDFNALYLAALAKREKGCTCANGAQSPDCPAHGQYVREALQREKAREDAANVVEERIDIWEYLDCLGAKLAPTKTCYWIALHDRRESARITHLMCIVQVGENLTTTRHKATFWQIPEEYRTRSGWQMSDIVDNVDPLAQVLTPAFMFHHPGQAHEAIYKTLKLI